VALARFDIGTACVVLTAVLREGLVGPILFGGSDGLVGRVRAGATLWFASAAELI